MTKRILSQQTWQTLWTMMMRTMMATLGLTWAMWTTTPIRADNIIYIDQVGTPNYPSSGNGWSFENKKTATANDPVVTIISNGDYLIKGSTTANRIEISQGVTATITLDNVSITSSIASPFTLSPEGCTVTLRIEGNNTLRSTTTDNNPLDIYGAGLQVEGSASVTILGEGSLTATGGEGGAGIGGGYIEGDTGHIPGTITIKSGTINAKGGYTSAGIGGGPYATGGTIGITGGIVTATGGDFGAGIGGGFRGDGGDIGITGGTITATGGKEGAGIGAGTHSPNGGNISISGGIVTATGGTFSAGIGGSVEGAGGNITISGGTVLALSLGGQGDPAGIGGGALGNAGAINITGGGIFAWGAAGAGIGGGAGATGGSIGITGGTVMTNKIGNGNTGGVTPTTVSGSGTVIFAGSINADVTSDGNARMYSGLNLTESFIRAAAVNHQPIEVVKEVFEDVYRTVYDTVEVRVPDSIIVVHDTVRVYIPVSGMTGIVHDTTYVVHFVHDTTYVVRDGHDTIVVSIDTLWRTRFEIDTLWLGTLHIERTTTIDNRIYIIIDPGTGVEQEALADDNIWGLSDGSIRVRDKLANVPFYIYDASGRELHRFTSPYGQLSTSAGYLSSGTYLFYQSGSWSKFFVP